MVELSVSVFKFSYSIGELQSSKLQKTNGHNIHPPHPSNPIFQIHLPFSIYLHFLFAITRCARSDDARPTAHQRIVDNGRTQKRSCAEPYRVAGVAGNTAGLIAPLTFLVDILLIRRVRVGCGDWRLWTKACGRALTRRSG